MTRIALLPDAARTRLNIHVAPGARRPALVGRYGDGWKIRVAAPPERGRANDAVVALLADVLGIPRRDVRIVAGVTGRDKVVELSGLTAADAEERLVRESEGSTQ
jgi:uncharacterized protein